MNFTLECWVCLSNGTSSQELCGRTARLQVQQILNSTVLLSAGDRGGLKEHQKAKEALT